MAAPKKPQSKNNPNKRQSKKEPRIISSVECSSCKTPCLEYQKYKEKLLIKGKGRGLKCYI